MIRCGEAATQLTSDSCHGLAGLARETDVAELEDCRTVTIIMVMVETLPLAEIKAHLSEIVDRIEYEHDRVVLTRNGRPAAVIMSPDDLEALEDTLELMSDPKAFKEIQKAREDVARDRVVSADDLRAKYLRR
jgi:antitoxin YefM